MKKFNEYSGLDLSEVNRTMLERWREEHLFEQTLAKSEGKPSFVFFEGPPSANGMPGIHHVLARTIKDIFCRYKTMQGYDVKRKAGWDTHGLPVELGVEKNLGITKEDIGKKISVDGYNEACRREVMKYTREWETLTENMGYWVDMTDPYITYDNRYIESVWWLLAQLYNKGYLYKGYTIQPYSPAAGTGLSSHELNQPGCYRDVKDTTCVAQFEVTDAPEWMLGWGKPYILAWTTTPWTLPSNTALAVGPAIEYSVVRTYNPYSGNPETVVCATALLGSLISAKGRDLPLEEYSKGDKIIPWQVVHTITGNELVGLHYRQLIPWIRPDEGAFRVIPGDYVTTEDGTGIVHIAGTFGADDLRVSRQNGIPPLHLRDRDKNIRPMVDLRGRFYRLEDLDPDFVAERIDVEAYTPWAGRFVKNAYDPEADDNTETLDVAICMYLKQRDSVFRIEKHVHNYPHCWRTDKPVLYYPLDSWFIRVTAARDRLIELNQDIKWKPASTGTGRFGRWLENIQDWNLSRSRYWGTPLPVWRTEDAAEEICIDSVETLYREIDRAVAAGIMSSNPLADKGFVPGDYSAENYNRIDLHRPYVDDIVLVSPTGRPMHRETDLIDVWFDSGAMPYAQRHYPFENREAFDAGKLFPADFIAEGVDQTRGWFYTLHAIAGMIFDSPAYRAVISNGLVLAKDGNKMSKRLHNSVDPFKAIETYGSDPLRWYMIANSSPWDNLKFDEAGVAEISRKLFGTLHNVYNFFALYANLDNFDPTAPQVPVDQRPEIDRWFLSLLSSLTAEVTSSLDDYEPTRAARAIADFVNNNLSNWYVRLNRRRFWAGDTDTDKLSAFQTLYQALCTVSLLMAPFAPFYADRLYRDLTNGVPGAAPSVHQASFPVAGESNPVLERRMTMAQTLTSMVLSLRRKANIKVRQPLSRMLVPVLDATMREDLEAISQLVMTEVNVHELEIADTARADALLVKRVKPDFKTLGKKLGKNMKAVAAALSNISREDLATLESTGALAVALPDGTTATVDADDVEIIAEDIPGWLVAVEGRLTVALDVTLTPELERKGLARELVNRLQNLRKTRGYSITDRVRVKIVTDDAINNTITKVLEEYGHYITQQILASDLSAVSELPDDAPGFELMAIDPMQIRLTMQPDL